MEKKCPNKAYQVLSECLLNFSLLFALGKLLIKLAPSSCALFLSLFLSLSSLLLQENLLNI